MDGTAHFGAYSPDEKKAITVLRALSSEFAKQSGQYALQTTAALSAVAETLERRWTPPELRDASHALMGVARDWQELERRGLAQGLNGAKAARDAITVLIPLLAPSSFHP